MVHVLYGINLISKEKMGAMSSYDPKVIIFSLINDKFRVIVLLSYSYLISFLLVLKAMIWNCFYNRTDSLWS